MILLDTHTLVWMVLDPTKLSEAAENAIRAAQVGGGIGVSAITLWELAWLVKRGRVTVAGTMAAFIERATMRTAVRPITVEVAVLATQLPASYPADPCDRLIGATALCEGMALVTKDRQIRACRDLRTIW